ncbi:MAG: 30S ribosomal protein S20 [Alphaproteobacteria bacterium]|nr:30S ribosomal protein S20 [Alphaproteobacteria bacterium]NCB49533.1 30S ribosomal protein S20 [Alphaproteobacteria bacterium]
MAYYKSAKTRIKRNKKREIINGMRRVALRTAVKKVEKALTAGSVEEAKTEFNTAQTLLRRAVNKKVMKLNTSARTISRLAQKIKKASV